MANAVTGNRYEEGGGGNGGAGGGRPPRLPRWTRQEILVLIQGKKVAESRGRGGRAGRSQHMGAAAAGLVGAGSPVEPKWATVSSYCRRHGVNRGPVQCRKRWSNLASDYKKIKEWERRKGGEESFWAMRNDLRRERRLPGFFDREVYDILDGTAGPEPEEEEEDESWRRGGGVEPPRLPKGPMATTAGEQEEDDAAAVFDSGRTAAEDGLFSDSEPEQDDVAEEEDKEERPVAAAAVATVSAMPNEQQHHQEQRQQPEENPEKAASSRDGHKRKRASSGEEGGDEDNIQSQMMEVLDRNSRTLMAHLEAQNTNFQLDRDQRREHADSLVGVLSRVADALARIADKL